MDPYTTEELFTNGANDHYSLYPIPASLTSSSSAHRPPIPISTPSPAATDTSPALSILSQPSGLASPDLTDDSVKILRRVLLATYKLATSDLVDPTCGKANDDFSDDAVVSVYNPERRSDLDCKLSEFAERVGAEMCLPLYMPLPEPDENDLGQMRTEMGMHNGKWYNEEKSSAVAGGIGGRRKINDGVNGVGGYNWHAGVVAEQGMIDPVVLMSHPGGEVGVDADDTAEEDTGDCSVDDAEVFILAGGSEGSGDVIEEFSKGAKSQRNRTSKGNMPPSDAERADAVDSWVRHNAPLLQNLSAAQLLPPLGKRVSIELNEPTQFATGMLQSLANRGESTTAGHSSEQSQPWDGLLERYVDLIRWAKEYLRTQFGMAEVEDDIAVLLTIIANNFYEAHMHLVDSVVLRAVQNMKVQRRSHLKIADFSFGFDLHMSQDMPSFVSASHRVRDTLEAHRPRSPVLLPISNFHTTRSGRKAKLTPQAQLAVQVAHDKRQKAWQKMKADAAAAATNENKNLTSPDEFPEVPVVRGRKKAGAREPRASAIASANANTNAKASTSRKAWAADLGPGTRTMQTPRAAVHFTSNFGQSPSANADASVSASARATSGTSASRQDGSGPGVSAVAVPSFTASFDLGQDANVANVANVEHSGNASAVVPGGSTVHGVLESISRAGAHVQNVSRLKSGGGSSKLKITIPARASASTSRAASASASAVTPKSRSQSPKPEQGEDHASVEHVWSSANTVFGATGTGMTPNFEFGMPFDESSAAALFARRLSSQSVSATGLSHTATATSTSPLLTTESGTTMDYATAEETKEEQVAEGMAEPEPEPEPEPASTSTWTPVRRGGASRGAGRGRTTVRQGPAVSTYRTRSRSAAKSAVHVVAEGTRTKKRKSDV